MYENESDDEAPEAVTFQHSKEVTKSQKRDELSLAKLQKRKKREMNKARDAALKEQKAAKKAKMDALRLPDDVLESIEDDADASDKEEAETTGPSHLLTSQTANRIAFDSGSEGEPDDDVDSGVSSVARGKISVREVHAVRSRAFQAATEFRNVKNGGWNSNIKRQSAKERQLLKEKVTVSRVR